MKVLVIGGAGYIGSHVVKEFLEKKHEVTVYDDLSTGQEINLFPQAGFVEGNILDYSKLKEVLAKGFEMVIHLAAKKAVGESMENPQKYSENNITGSLNILNAMAETGVKHIVFSSSAAVYGMPQYLPIDEKHPINPINYYGFTKIAIEQFMHWYEVTKGLKFVALRYFNAVGYDESKTIQGREKNPQNLLPLIVEVAEGVREKLNVYGDDYPTPDGTCIRDYIHVSDLATAHVLAAEKLLQGMGSQSLNLGTGKGTSVKEIIEATEEILGRKLNVAYVGRRAGDPAELTASSKAANDLLGWTPKYLDIKKIIQTNL
ncbi:MAG: UDP-glucose 4-epimerase GalE [Alphaproteobacteria bacterium]|nr:UDP-glucose 4-epimerase GalE [Alphaproteobacteria bacterium]